MNALANDEVGKYLAEHFVSSFQKVATFKIAGGQKQGGNVASYFCAPDGRVLHVVAGPVDAATMLRESGEHPVILREAVTSPGGTTINAIRELERHGVRAAFLAAIEAARDRGRELAGG